MGTVRGEGYYASKGRGLSIWRRVVSFTEIRLGETPCSWSWKTHTYLHSIQLPKHILPTEKARRIPFVNDIPPVSTWAISQSFASLLCLALTLENH